VVIYHAAINTVSDYLERCAPHWQAHLERITALRARGLVIGGGPSPDRQRADLFYRLARPSEITRLIEEDPYWLGKVWAGYTLRSFGQFVEPWELPPPAPDGSRIAVIVEGEATEPEMATFALIELRGAGRMAFGGFLEGETTLALMKTGDSEEAIAWLADTGFWKTESLTARPILYVL
jgi:uncharacterized protein YciI